MVDHPVIRMLEEIQNLSAKLAAAEAKVAQCREVLREREFAVWNTDADYYCASCGADEDEEHETDCAWKRAMEDA